MVRMKNALKKIITSLPVVGPASRKLGKAYRDWRYDAAWQIRRALRGVEIEYVVLRQEIRDMVIDQDRVVTRRVCRMRHRGTGKVMNVDFCDWMRFQDGLVCELSLSPEASQLEELVE